MALLSDNSELLAAFREGRRSALETVYREYARSLDVYLRVLARRSGVAELSQASVVQDLLQETFLKAFSASARRSYDATRDFAPYLRAIARNCFIDALRTRRCEARVPEEIAAQLAPSTCFDEDYDPKVLAALETYLRELPPSLEQVYQARFVRGESQEQACAALGLSRRSLRTQEDHLRRGLRKALLLAGLLHIPSFGPLQTSGE